VDTAFLDARPRFCLSETKPEAEAYFFHKSYPQCGQLCARVLASDFQQLKIVIHIVWKNWSGANKKKPTFVSASPSNNPVAIGPVQNPFFRGREQGFLAIQQFSAVTSSPQSQTIAGGVSFAIENH